MRTRIEIDTPTFVRFWLVVFGFAFIALLLYMARGALLVLGIAFFLALALSRPVSHLSKKLPGNSRVGATAVAFLAVVAFIGAIVFLVVPPIIDQSVKLANNFPTWVENAQRQWGGLNDVVQKYNLQPQIDQAINGFKSNLSSFAGSAGQSVINGVGSVISFIGMSLIVLFISFFMLIEGPEWMKRIWALYKDRSTMERHKALVNRMYNIVTSYVTGQLTISAIDGASAAAGVLIVSLFFQDVPTNLVLPIAALSFLMSLIPMFGASIGMVVSTVLIALNSLPAAIVYAIYFVIYQQIEANVVTPLVQSKANNLTALIILVAVTTGILMFGLVGGIIAIPIAGCIKILVEEYIAKIERERARVASRTQPAVKVVPAKTK